MSLSIWTFTSGHDVENLDEGDIFKAAPDIDYRNEGLPVKDFCKDKNNKKLTMCKKGEYYELDKIR